MPHLNAIRIEIIARCSKKVVEGTDVMAQQIKLLYSHAVLKLLFNSWLLGF